MFKLIDYLPTYYQKSTDFQTISSAVEKQLDRFGKIIEQWMDNFHPSSADSVTLSRFEILYNIKTLTTADEVRRSNIVAKTRGASTTTVANIETILSAYDSGDVLVTDNTSTYEIIIKFISQKGTPSDIEQVKKLIRDIVPAHIGITYQYAYNTWAMVSGHYATWGDLAISANTWESIKTEEWGA